MLPAGCYPEVILPLAVRSTFSYEATGDLAEKIQPGMRVMVPVGKRKTYLAMVYRVHSNRQHSRPLKPILSLVDDFPVMSELQFRLWEWISSYYLCTLGEVYKAAFPAVLKKSVATRKRKREHAATAANTLPTLTGAQEQALLEIREAFKTHPVALLHGVTSSGKTEIYIRLISEMLENNRQVLYLLPEIALTTQMIIRLESVFGNRVAVYHSRSTDSERASVWHRLTKNIAGDKQPVQVILGVRSSLFLPLNDLGLIIVDEEHEHTFKQFDPAPRYHARDTAIMLGKICGAPVLLGTATPSAESYHNCVTGKYGLVTLGERYMNLQLPEITLVNIRELKRKKMMHASFSPLLLQSISETVELGHQVILFQNRRGFSLFITCNTCGHVPHCRNCDVSLIYHKQAGRLVCHYCGYSCPLPAECPACKAADWQMRGFGTEKIEEELALLLPGIRIIRMDHDTTGTRRSYEKLLGRFAAGEADVLVGTQMVSKGLDFEHVRLVGIMHADGMFNYPDFRAHERSFQLMAQVSGRAGRKSGRGRVIIQTANPDHPVIPLVAEHNFEGMYRWQMAERKQFNYPPFSRLLSLTLKDRDKERIDRAAEELAGVLRPVEGVTLMGPEYPLVSRMHNLYLKSLLLKINRVPALSAIKALVYEHIVRFQQTPGFKSIQVVIDVDPY